MISPTTLSCFVGLALAVALVVGGCRQQPVSSLSGAVKEPPAWDDSTALDAGDGPLVMTGPVLHRAVDSVPAALQVVSRRCYLVSLGFGFLVELDANERAQHDGAPALASLWQPNQLAQSQACERAFGAGFRLPTRREAEVWLARYQDLGPIFSQDAGKLGSVRREFLRCEGSGACPAARLVASAPRPGTLRCVGPLESRPHAVPSEPEVRACVAAFGGVSPNQGDSSKLVPLDPVLLDVVVAARQACLGGGAAYEQLRDALRRRVGSGTIVALARQAWDDERVASEARATLHSVRGQLGEPRPFDCETAPASYQRGCHDPLARDCLLLQARFGEQCQQIDVAPQLASAARDWDAEALRIATLRNQVLMMARAARVALRCSERDPAPIEARQALREVLGTEPLQSSGEWQICPCPIDDLACGLSALRSGGRCPETPGSTR
jgi:hypothetical protein